MKNIITLIFITIASNTNAQVIIGDDDTGSAISKNSVLLDFATGQNKGIILPYVRTLPTNPTEGTLLLDATNPEKAHVKYFNGEWISLSGDADSNISDALANQPLPEDIKETSISKTIFGGETTTEDGVLVLESQTRLLVLPTVNDVQDIVNPSPGMIVYVNKANAKRLAVFNGSKWAYWKKP
ncbi:hypothetical protein SAMN05443634_103234 [Chishuiella changwenlii]|uniref:Uncharacterized protein n=1 Tax=Chishuiella changwenlii TaxID=1434701 RepID=A0A1M6V951_9FLAO|nr:hypothetical protein [Chishuiella changwenlii]GGF01437.1 hypothetical protein GCM10010984_18650 [Chishuiella changwenlii]SHK77978.1 hypothetical protein SAMN05443634_103234 [Chishuiella changwenlii]